MDFTLLEPAQNGMENVLIMTDVFSKFTQAIPTWDQCASTVAQALVTEWFYKFGVPSQLHSDQGRSFESSLNQQLCGLYGFVIRLAMGSVNGLAIVCTTFCEHCLQRGKGIGPLASPSCCFVTI